MNYNNQSEMERIVQLMNFGINEKQNSDAKKSPVVEYQVKAADNKTYGIVNEGNKFYIKVAPAKDTQILNEDFDYIGGFNNRKEYEYNSYNMASKQLELKLKSINEAFGEKYSMKQIKSEPSDWQVNETKEMRGEIERFKQICNNVNFILTEDKKGMTLAHTLPEAPSSNPSEKEVNAPFTDTAVAKGDKDFKTTTSNHEKVGPFDKDGKVANSEMQSDKMKGTGNSDKTFSEKAKYVPDNSVANKKPSGGKVTHVNEGKRTIKLTEEQVLAWNKSKDFMDKSHGTEIGSSAPFTDELGEESNQTEANTESIHESENVVHNTDNQNSPAPGTSEVGDTAPFDKKVNEEIVDADDAAGMPDSSELPFPEVADGGAYLDFEQEYNDWENSQDGNFDIDQDASSIASLDGQDEFEIELDDDSSFDFNESRRQNGKSISEGTTLNDFGKHPAYQKVPMTTPPNKEVAKNGARDWNDKSVEGEQPYGKQIGSTAPFSEKVIDMLTDTIMKKMGFQSKA